MRIRLRDTPDKIQAFAEVFRKTFVILDESTDYLDRAPSNLVHRYLEIELTPEIAATPSPLALATDAKHSRDLLGEISILTDADKLLNSQWWYPLQNGDVVLMAAYDDLATTYLAEPDEYGDHVLRCVSAVYESSFHEPIPFYDLWFEAGPATLTVIRAGATVFGRPTTRQAPATGSEAAKA